MEESILEYMKSSCEGAYRSPAWTFFHYERSVLPMALLETNDWMVLNNIIYQINYLKDSQEMRENLLKQLLLIIDFDSANFCDGQ